MKENRFLYLPIEVKARELDAKLLVAAEACRQGFSVIIGTKALNHLLKSGPRGIYFYKDVSAPMADKLKEINGFGHKIVVHDEEGLVQQNDDDYINRRLMFDTIKYVNIFFCWGTHQAKSIKKVKEIFDSEVDIKVTGHPRFDLLLTPLKGYNSQLQKNKKRTILINTKLAECNHQRGKNGWLDLLKNHNMLHSESCLALRLDQIEYKKSLLKHYKRLVQDLSVRYPNDEIVIRPHPSENIGSWEEWGAGLKNVLVSKQHNIGYWLNRSDIVIHTGCTTAIEAYAAGVPVITFKPVYDKRFEISLPDKISLSANSSDECMLFVEELLNDSLRYSSFDKEYKNILKPHIENIEGNFSYKKIVKILNSLEVPSQKLSLLSRVRWRIRNFLSVSKRYIKEGSTVNHRDISILEIENGLKMLCAAIKIERPSIIKLKKNVYLLESK